MKKAIIISGPTATGKSQLALELAQEENCEIINFDSLLFYKELNIGTAKPTLEERQVIPHHLVDLVSFKESFNAADFYRACLKLLENSNFTPIFVGGSGFYLQTLLKGMYPSNTPSKDILGRSEKLYQEQGIDPFLTILKQQDPQRLSELHSNDHYRLRRAVEHFWSSGVSFSQAKKEFEEVSPPLQGQDILHLYLDIPKEKHYEIIKERTQKMLAQGLLTEVKGLMALGANGQEKSLRSIGYSEAFAFLTAQEQDEAKLVEQIVISTRQLAKAQRTWFKKISPKLNFNPLEEKKAIKQAVKNFIR